MISLEMLKDPVRPLKILCCGAHCDDIEIGCGGTLLQLTRSNPACEVLWVTFSSTEERANEARVGAARFLQHAATKQVEINAFRDGFFPYVGGQIKERFELLKQSFSPDLVLTHCRHDLHQDHRVIAELTWNTFRHHLILEYEIAKYDADLQAPNIFFALEESTCRDKVRLITETYGSQKDRSWFDDQVFWALLRLRGLEANAATRFAEGFYGRKIVL